MSDLTEARKVAERALMNAGIDDYSSRYTSDKVINAFLAALRKDYAIVPRERLIADVAKLMAQMGNSLSPETMHPITNKNEPWGDPIGQQPAWKFHIDDAAAMIAAYEGEG